ncbi:MAG: hypothetical protein J6V07_05280 [Clostridia bacterium]|nr:hypothetical protein [Clostridia bacterium]
MQKAGRLVKSLLVLFMFLLAGLLFFRFWLNGFYPGAVRRTLPTEPLLAAYAEAGELAARRQEIRVSYDDPNEGLFFANHMMLVPDTGSLQVTVRWNSSTLDRLAAEYGEAFDKEAEAPFTYRLFAATDKGEEIVLSGKTEIRGSSYLPVARERASFAMYRYERLAFEGLDFEGVSWIRLEISHAASETYESDILIYENHEEYNEFEDFTIKELS